MDETLDLQAFTRDSDNDQVGLRNIETVMQTIKADNIRIRIGNLSLCGDLAVPHGATGIVLFAHGSGSSRLSRRNRAVAASLQRSGIGTLLFDLLSPEEDADAVQRFNISLLTARLCAATERVSDLTRHLGLPMGYFGASTGAAAAIRAGLSLPKDVQLRAVVSRGGRVDLAGYDALSKLRAPTLLIVGGADPLVLEANARARTWMKLCESRLEIVPGATHLFEEPGALERVSDLAGRWFHHYFSTEKSADAAEAGPVDN